MLQENTTTLEAIPIDENASLGWDDEESGPKKITENRICSLCFWAPLGYKTETPIINIATIKECSRYEKKD